MMKISLSGNIIVSFLVAILIVATRVKGAELSRDDELVTSKKISEICAEFDSVKTLDAFDKFYQVYSKLNQCLRKPEPASECQEAEQVCLYNGILYSSVVELGDLLARIQRGGRTCTIEFSARLYRLHGRVTQLGSQHGLSKILRVLANRWASRCKKTVASRLLEVETRAPDLQKHLNLILGIMSYGTRDQAGQIGLDVEDFIPVLSDELKNRDESIGLAKASGFEYKLSQTLRLALDGARMSCNSLKRYYVNILGSLGLLASKGYAALSTKSSNDAAEKRRIEQWVMGGILCQALGTILKQGTIGVKGKARTQVKIIALSEPDVTSLEEIESEFASYNLSEDREPLKLDAEVTADDSFVCPINLQSNLRKLQMLEGPNERLANALYAFLDMNAPDRKKIPYRILGIRPPVEQLKTVSNDDDDDDDDDDE